MAAAVSVVLPTFNRAGTLPRAIDSVLNQTFGDFEIIVVDDGSTDATRAALSRYTDPRIRTIATVHRGCSAARNTGIAAATGDYIAFQDSDDEWEPRKLATAIASLESDGHRAGVFYSDMLVVLPDGRAEVLASPRVTQGAFIDEGTLDYQVRCIGIQSTVVRRECLERVGGFDETLPRLIDLDLLIRLSDEYPFVRSPEPLVKYYLGPAGISTDRDALVVARRRLLDKYRARLRRRPHQLASQYLFLAAAMWDNGQKLPSVGALLRALATCPTRAQIRTAMQCLVAYARVPGSLT